MTKGLLSTKEAAEILGFNEETLQRWRRDGSIKIPFCRIGRIVKYKRSDIDNFIKKSRIAS